MKVICLGFHKTGTTSFSAFMGQLGFRSAHWLTTFGGEDLQIKSIPVLDDRRAIFKVFRPAIEHCDALADVPFPALYEEISEAYPNAKFVLLRRDMDDWWDSLSRHWKMHRRDYWPLGPFEYVQYNKYTEAPLRYVTKRDRSLLVDIHEKHLESCTTFFRDSADRLLMVDCYDSEIGPKLCRFLGKPEPGSYPHRQRGSRIRKALYRLWT